MNFGQARLRLVLAGAAMSAVVLVSGCGNNAQSTVTTSGSTGPAAQPTSYVAVVSAPSTTAAGIATPGIATIFDYSGDTWMAQASIGPGPYTFALDSLGSTGYTLNSNNTISAFTVSKSVKDSDVESTTLPGKANPLNLYMTVSALWAADLDGNVADVFTGSPETYVRPVPLAPTPVFVAGPGSNTQRIFGISQGNSQGDDISSPVQCNVSPTTAPLGEADVIESSYTISAKIPLGKCPVYAVESGDSGHLRLFVLNRGSDTVTVINTQTGLKNECAPFTDSNTGRTVTCHSTLPLSTTAGLAQDAKNDVPSVAGPVYAEYNIATNQLVIANYDGGTISIIDVSLDEYGNDSASFGTTYTVPVGKNPASVTVLYQGDRAYTANQTDQTVSIVNLSSHTVVGTLPVTGYPRTVVSTQNSSYGKVYVASPNSNVLTIIRTDEDIVGAAPTVEGHIVDVRVSNQSAISTNGNSNTTSRRPGYGQPCNLPPSLMVSTYGSAYKLADCQKQP